MPLDDRMFLDHTRGRGLVEVFLRGHLWVERYLAGLIEADLEDPDPLRLARMPYAQKVNLAQALGLVTEDEAATLRLIGSMRNRLAHDLAGEPTSEDLAKLKASLTGPHRHGFDALAGVPADKRSGPEDDPEEVRHLSWVFLAIVYGLEVHRMRHAYNKAYGPAVAMYEMFKRLDERTPGLPSMAEELRRQHPFPDPPDPRDIWVRHEHEGGDA